MPGISYLEPYALEKNSSNRWYMVAPPAWPKEEATALLIERVEIEDWIPVPNPVDDSAEFIHRIMDSIEAACEEAGTDDWYGPGSISVSAEVCDHAISFAKQLSPRYGDPDVFAHPDGEIAFEWYYGPRMVVTASIGKSDQVHFAGLFGNSRIHGADHGAMAVAEIERLLSRINLTASM